LRQQPFQQPTAILQQGGPQGLLDPFGGPWRSLRQPLLEQFQEGFGFPVALGVDFLEFFLASAARSRRVWFTVTSTNSSARAWNWACPARAACTVATSAAGT
jgi:hypothetical protein